MAIKFVDKEPEGDRSKKADAPPVKREPDAAALKKSVDPELSHVKPAHGSRGRKRQPRQITTPRGQLQQIPTIHRSTTLKRRVPLGRIATRGGRENFQQASRENR